MEPSCSQVLLIFQELDVQCRRYRRECIEAQPTSDSIEPGIRLIVDVEDPAYFSSENPTTHSIKSGSLPALSPLPAMFEQGLERLAVLTGTPVDYLKVSSPLLNLTSPSLTLIPLLLSSSPSSSSPTH